MSRIIFGPSSDNDGKYGMRGENNLQKKKKKNTLHYISGNASMRPSRELKEQWEQLSTFNSICVRTVCVSQRLYFIGYINTIKVISFKTFCRFGVII